MCDQKWYDLYLWIFPKSDELYRIKHISEKDSNKYYNDWLNMNELHDGMQVLEGSTPWSEPAPTITDVTPDWINEQHNELENNNGTTK